MALNELMAINELMALNELTALNELSALNELMALNELTALYYKLRMVLGSDVRRMCLSKAMLQSDFLF